MNKKLKNNIIKAASFLLIFVLLFVSLDSIMQFKYNDSLRLINEFYNQEEDTVDVLVIGSSHSYTNFRPHIFWNNYGYSSFIIGGSIQPLWNSYYYLEEALKTQTPKIIILEGYRLVEQKEYTTPYYAIKNTYGLKLSKTKLMAMKESFEPSKFMDYAFQFTNYHSRYTETSRADFVEFYDNEYYRNYKGELNKQEVYDSLKAPNVAAYSTKEKKMAAKTEEYYIKMLELAKEHNIPLVTVIAPYNMPQGEYGYYKYAEKIAAKYGMPFINTNEMYDELNIDFKTDFADQYGHLNSSGSDKLTDFVGNYISMHYDVPDHRGDEKYESWQLNAEQFARNYNNPIKEETNLVKYIEKCESEGDYSYIFIVNDYDLFELNVINELDTVFENLNIGDRIESDGVWVIRNGKIKYQSSDTDLDKNIHFDSRNDIRLRYGSKKFSIEIADPEVFYACANNNDTVRTMPWGVTLIVYDELFKRVAETVYYECDQTELTRVNELLAEK